jgi:hypothetical protein
LQTNTLRLFWTSHSNGKPETKKPVFSESIGLLFWPIPKDPGKSPSLTQEPDAPSCSVIVSINTFISSHGPLRR